MKPLLALLVALSLAGCALNIPKTDVALGIVKQDKPNDVGVAVSLTGTCTGVLSAFGAEQYCVGIRWLVAQLVPKTEA